MVLQTGTPYDTVDAFGGYDLGDNDSFYLGPNVAVFSTAHGVRATGNDQSVIIQGSIIGTYGVGVGNSSTDTGANIRIMAGGSVSGYALDSAGIYISGNGATIVNEGTISGHRGIYIYGGNSGTTTITNSGFLLSDIESIYLQTQNKVVLVNTGEIQSLNSASYQGIGLGAVDIVINKGLMRGNVLLQAGDDTYDGRGGRVVGNVQGHENNDKILGGSFIDRFDGGTGTDTLTGGLAKDVLTGGTESDKFVFNAVAEIGDTITDFTTADFMVFKSSAFGSLTKGTLSSAAFRSNESGKAQDASDRFIYETDTDKLWYDKDGTDSSARVLVTDFAYNVNMTRGDILIA